MKAEWINPFLNAAINYLAMDTNISASDIGRGNLSVEDNRIATRRDVTILVAVTGDVQGVVTYSLNEGTACRIVATILGEPTPIYSDIVASAVAEMGNVITGLAGGGLEKMGYTTDIAPPYTVRGRGAIISTIDIPRLVVPLTTPFGEIDISIALQERKK